MSAPASPASAFGPVEARGRGPSGRVALGLVTAALITLVGISLVGQTGEGRPGSQAAVGGPTAEATATAVATASPTATPEPFSTAAAPPTATPERPPGTPLPRVSVPVGPVPVCPPGSTPDEPGPVDQPRPPTDSFARMAIDRDSGRIVLLAGRPDPARPETWTFDGCSNTWTRMQPNREPVLQWGGLVYDVDSDVTIAVDENGNAWAFDLEANTWTEKGIAPKFRSSPRFVYDPVSGDVVVLAPATELWELWAYDVETDTWTPLRQEAPPLISDLDHVLLAYDASVDRIIAYDGILTWLLDARTGTWTRTGAVTPAVNTGWFASGGEIAYDEARQRTVVFSDGRVIAYDAAADRWEILVEGFDPHHGEDFGTGPTSRLYHSMVYDPVNERLVVYGGMYRTSGGWVTANDVLAFDPATGRWIVLLDASEVRVEPQ